MPTISRECSDCGAATQISFGDYAHGPELRWYQSTSCPGCGSRSEMDGRVRLPDDLRALVLQTDGSWSVCVTPIDRTRTFALLRTLFELSMSEVAQLAAALPGPIQRGRTFAEATSLATAFPNDVAAVEVRREAG